MFIGLSSTLWLYGLSSFQAGGTKSERFFPKNQHTQRKWLNFDNWINGKVSKSAKIEEYEFRSTFLSLKFFDNIDFLKIHKFPLSMLIGRQKPF